MNLRTALLPSTALFPTSADDAGRRLTARMARRLRPRRARSTFRPLIAPRTA
ncbi:hypothetical protein [Microbacterium kunmingense]|uniref:hypothetical protein n=1 Tax=Microbacterium kunmingense TaxID=2915939 RepID=UPI002002F2DA|nr:hypothetical protein [Microbacterium kunmingense]